MESIYLTIVLAPLLGAIVAGLFGRQVGRGRRAHRHHLGVAISFALSVGALGPVWLRQHRAGLQRHGLRVGSWTACGWRSASWSTT
jgi:NADH:ubiquinone oxidoreductase subunit 5 (subunit L)/multisubunit Na+/H+ antiporter MnhA subunit